MITYKQSLHLNNAFKIMFNIYIQPFISKIVLIRHALQYSVHLHAFIYSIDEPSEN